MTTSRPRGRPLSFDREAALDQVIPVFWERGFASPSLDELAEAAGLNRPNLTAAFGNKQELYVASLERFLSSFANGANKSLSTPGNLQNALNRFFDFAVALYAGQGLGCFVFGTTPAAASVPSIRAELAKALKSVQDMLRERIIRSIGQDLHSDANTEGMATALSGVLFSLALHARAGVPEKELRKMHRRAVAAILN